MSDNPRMFDEELPAFVAGRLEPERAHQVEAWLDDHPDRKELVEDWKQIAWGLREGGAAVALACPPPSLLIDWARGERTDPTGFVPRHLDTCASCSLEVEAAKRNRPRQIQPVRRAPRAVIYRFVSLAAAAGLVVGLSLGLVLDLDEPGGTMRAPGGPVHLLQLDPSLRGGGAGTTSYRIEPAQAWVPVALLPELPASSRAEDLFRFSILEAGDGEVWSKELTAAAIESHLAASGVLVFLVPAQALEPGAYTMRIGLAGDPGSPPLLRVPFTIE